VPITGNLGPGLIRLLYSHPFFSRGGQGWGLLWPISMMADPGWSVPPVVGNGDWPTYRLAGAGQGGKGLATPSMASQSARAVPALAPNRGRDNQSRPNPDLAPWQSRALAYADCREGPELRIALHRPGATRHPWRDAPSYGHPDRAPATCNPPHGPADGADIGVVARTDISPLDLINKSQIKLIFANRAHSTG
jgi:hypothetical protein